MNYAAYIASFGALLPSGLYSTAGHGGWQTGQRGAFDVTRDQVIDKPYPGFGKLAIADRLAFAAAALALRGCEAYRGETCGITLGTAFGSLSTDLRYMESVAGGFPSPALFSATLPSSPIADIAIYFGLKGPCRVFCDSSGAGTCALEQGFSLLHCGKASTVLVIVLNAVDPADQSCALLSRPSWRENRAYAFLLTARKAHNGHACAVHATFETSDAGQNGKPEEVYFDELLGLLRTHQTGTILFDGKWNYHDRGNCRTNLTPPNPPQGDL